MVLKVAQGIESLECPFDTSIWAMALCHVYLCLENKVHMLTRMPYHVETFIGCGT